MTDEEFIDSAVKALAKLPNNAARRAALNAKIEACHQAHELAQIRMKHGLAPPKLDFMTIEARIGALQKLRGQYQEKEMV